MVGDCLCAEEHIDVGHSKRLGLQDWMETWQKRVTCYKNIRNVINHTLACRRLHLFHYGMSLVLWS